jgi:cobalamin biosynthesis protein CobD/CbiB
MMRVGTRIAWGVLGVVLVLVFLGWLLIRQHEALSMDNLLGWVVWALAWACLFGGASLLARATVSRRSDDQAADGPES